MYDYSFQEEYKTRPELRLLRNGHSAPPQHTSFKLLAFSTQAVATTMTAKIASAILMAAGLFLVAPVLLADAEVVSGASAETGASANNIRVVKGVGAEVDVKVAGVEDAMNQEGELGIRIEHEEEENDEEDEKEEEAFDGEEDMVTAEREADEEGEDEEEYDEEEEDEAKTIERMTVDSGAEKRDVDNPVLGHPESVRTQPGKGERNGRM